MTATTTAAPAPPSAPAPASALSAKNATLLAAAPGVSTVDRIAHLRLSSVTLPLATPISDAKVLTGRQKPMTEVAFLFVEVTTQNGHTGIGFSYSKRAGGPGQYAHAKEIADVLIGEDPSDIGKLWVKLCWAGASVGRSGLATQAIAAFDVALWDLKAKRASLPLSKLLGSYRDSVRTYNTSGGFLHTPIEQVKENAAAALEGGIGGIKLKVGQPDWRTDVARVTAVREYLDDDVPLMVDANQQWDRASAMRMGRIFEEFGLVWIEEPLDAYDAEGHAQLARSLDTSIATGEMLASLAEHARLIEVGAADVVQPDAPRIGGITQFLKLSALAESKQLEIAPHFAMEIHCHLAAAYPIEPWVEHFDWLDPLFNEHLETRDGRMWVSDRPGLGFTLSEQAAAWTVATSEFGQRP
ncbi:MAG TPA: mandelate racemase/muconate lactonizing enzyme family protein [Microlunatus sp.]